MNKTIFICYKNLSIIEKYSLNWKRLNPDWNIELYDDNKCKEFLLINYGPLYVEIFNFLKDGPIKSDFWRVCILYKYGGLYVDADIEPLIPLKTYIEENDEFITCTSSEGHSRGNFKYKNNWHSNPHFIYCKYKKFFIFKYCINTYLNMYKLKIKYNYWDWSIVGIFNKLDFFPNKKISCIFYFKKIKFKLLLEHNCSYCSYNKIKIFNNRYKTYKKHKFIE